MLPKGSNRGKPKRCRGFAWAIVASATFLLVTSSFISFHHHVGFYVVTPSKYLYQGRDSGSLDPTKVAITGAAGNIGSYLTLHLRSVGFNVVAYDMDPRIADFVCLPIHSRSIHNDDLQTFGTVVFLGGCTGRKSCANLPPTERSQVNTLDVVDIFQRMSPNQHLIVASTSAISEGRLDAKESDRVFVDLLDEYSLSMYQREVKLEELVTNSAFPEGGPQVSIVRFGTVVGVSPGQRTDLLVPSLFKAAYTRGVMKVQRHDAMRSFLALPDLARSFHVLIASTVSGDVSGPDGATTMALGRHDRLKIWNLASFHATILKIATTVASITGATLDVEGTTNATNTASSPGFTLNCQAFVQRFNFSFQETLLSTLSYFDENIPESVTPKGAHLITVHQSPHEEHATTIPCPVCRSKDQLVVLDLGSQPFANDFQTDLNKALQSTRFPLKLVRCRVCNHYHLSHVANREELFQHYLYQSGTSTTLKEYFRWLANKVVQETVGVDRHGSVLELACNDGSQLDQFKALGWNTFGVDPAENLASIAQKKNHTIRVGFWPLKDDFQEMPRGDDLTAIVAQNVLAHVPHPVDFLKACAAVMGPKTKLYIQTSQCNMQQLGQFDTMYHEHVSFFTGHSFDRASDLAGLYITSFETTPIHGTSCLVTMELKASHKESPVVESLAIRLADEARDGITSDFFGEKYTARASAIRDWVIGELRSLKAKGFVVLAYGAAAKGMTLLHFILDARKDDTEPPLFEWVLDDALLKQNTYCPGTAIPVRATKSVAEVESKKPLAIVILAWNFFDEIIDNVVATLQGKRAEFLAIVPFPTPRIVRIHVETNERYTLREMPYNPTSIPNILRDSQRRQVLLVSHHRNEEMLMPFFIIQHAPMFDHAILIDFISTDKTLEILDKYAPPSWRVENSTIGEVFDAIKTDQQVMVWEQQYPDDWTLALTTTEFLVHPNFRSELYRHQIRNPRPVIRHYRVWYMMGNDTTPLRHFTSLVNQRHQFLDSEPIFIRFLHVGTSFTHKYDYGRHNYTEVRRKRQKKNRKPQEISHEGFIMKWVWTPWPEVAQRKLDVGKTIPQSDQERGFGTHHTARTSLAYVEAERSNELDLAGKRKAIHDFCDDDDEPQYLWARFIFHSFSGNVCQP